MPEMYDVAKAFAVHPADRQQASAFEIIRDAGRQAALNVTAWCPDCPERERALERLQEAVMWANAGIARHGIKQS